MVGKKGRKNYTLEDRKKYMDEWERQGKPPRGRFCKTEGLTNSMFARWLQIDGRIPLPAGGITGGTPPHLRTQHGGARGGSGGAGKRKSDAVIRAALLDVYGPPRMKQDDAAKKHGCNKSSFSFWRHGRPELMPGKTEVVPDLFQTLDGRQMPPKQLPPPPNGAGLQLEMGADQQAAGALFEQSQADAWSELMAQLEPLPPRARLRILTLIEKIQT